MSVTFLTDKSGCLIVDKQTAAIASTNYAAKAPTRQLVSHISAAQSGTGTPSSDNVRPITGWDSVSLYHAANYSDSAEPVYSTNLTEIVYGGTMDWLTGVLTVTHTIFVPTGDDITNYGTASTGVPYVQFALPVRSGGVEVTCSHYPMTTGVPTKSAVRVVKPNGCYIYDTRFTDRTTAASLLNVEKPQIVYALETPYTVQFDPVTLEMLEGDNALWSNTGETTVWYAADTKMYIDARITETLKTTSASTE